jgi:hypothetical protein
MPCFSLRNSSEKVRNNFGGWGKPQGSETTKARRCAEAARTVHPREKAKGRHAAYRISPASQAKSQAGGFPASRLPSAGDWRARSGLQGTTKRINFACGQDAVL